jgi:transposase-like protein
MVAKSKLPKSLQQAIRYFSDEQVCIDTVAELRWPDGPSCPACEHKEHYYLKTQKRWKCKACGRQFSVKLGTIFEDSALSLDKWLCALWMLVNCKNGVSSHEIARTLEITQKSAWFMLQRLRLALQSGSLVKLGGDGGEVEVDETYIGGKARNMHKSRKQRLTGVLTEDKTTVMGFLERGGKVRMVIVGDRQRETMRPVVKEHVDTGAALYSDNLAAYRGLREEYDHKIVDHATRYVDGRVHTNGLENFWSLLKRGLNGTYVAVEPFHLFRYLDEQAFRFNTRKDADGKRLNDGQRFQLALSQVAGKRLTYQEVTGKVGETAF